MARFSANLGFLWTELALPDAIRAAARAGFDAVECHFPYSVAQDDVNAALADSDLAMLGLNTVRGDVQAGDFGLSAIPGREVEARAAIDEAIDYAARIRCRNVHVMAGRSARLAGARETYVENLAYAAGRAARHGVGVLIEPINHRDVSDYFLFEVEQAAAIVTELGESNVKVMFDCYHTQIMQGDLLRRLEAHLNLIGHIQIAAVPSRAEPDEGEVAFDRLIVEVDRLGYDGFIGAEYKPRGSTEEGLNWLRAMKR